MRRSPIQEATAARNRATMDYLKWMAEMSKRSGKKLTRKQVAALKRHLARNRIKMSVGACRAVGGKPRAGSEIVYSPVVVCRRGKNRWELL